MNLRRKLLLGSVVLVGLVGATLAVKRPKPAPPAPPPAAERVLDLAATDLLTVQGGELVRALPLTGVLKPYTQTVVKAKVAGELVELAVREGEAVRAGQVVARIDPAEYASRVAERQGSLDAARAQWRYAEQTRRNNEELLRKNFISKNAYDNWSTNSHVGEAQVRAAEASLELARKSLADTQVRAPVAGVVSERLAQPGEKVAVDGRLLSIVDLSRLELEAAVPAAEIPAVRVGHAVEFAVEGHGERRFAGRVTRINPATQAGTRSILIYVEVPNADAALRGGMFAQGHLVLGTRQAGVLAPRAALREEGGVRFVYAVIDGRLRRQAVDIAPAASGEARVEVLKGLAPGTAIVAADLGALPDGATVRTAAAR